MKKKSNNENVRNKKIFYRCKTILFITSILVSSVFISETIVELVIQRLCSDPDHRYRCKWACTDASHTLTLKTQLIIVPLLTIWSLYLIIAYLRKSAIVQAFSWAYNILGLLIAPILNALFIGAECAIAGRPLNVKNKKICTKIKEGTNWSQISFPDTCISDVSTCKAIETLWLQNAKGEHASIPAFSRISIQLVATGAPAELVEWSHKAALDEIKHAQLCFSMAKSYGKRSYSVSPMPELVDMEIKPKSDDGKNILQVIAKESIIDGLLMEGFFADVAFKSFSLCKEPIARDVLEQIAKDERSHAELAEAILEWSLSRDPSMIYSIIEEALSELTSHQRPKAFPKSCEHLIQKADLEILQKHGHIKDEYWLDLWNKRIANVRSLLKAMVNSKTAA